MSGENVLFMNNGQRILSLALSELKKWNIQIPEWQRFLNEDRIEGLFRSMLKSFSSREEEKNMPLLQTGIILTELKNRFSIIDGQHRFKAFEKLHLQFGTDFEILVIIIPVKKEEEIFQFCRMINDSQPLNLPDHPDHFVTAKNITEILQHKYYPFFSSSLHPRRPNVNADQFSQRLAELIALGENPHVLYEKIENLNSKFRDAIEKEKNVHQFIHPGDTLEKVEKMINIAQKKAISAKFYLGLCKNYEWMSEINSHFARKPHHKTNAASSRVGFPRAQRRVIWNAKIGRNKISGHCHTCGRNLDFDSCQIGHNLAVAKGGNNDIDNLEIICAHCNLEMGTKDLADFKRILTF